MSTLNYNQLKRDYKKMESNERAINRDKTRESKIEDNFENDKRQNLETKKEFWDYLSKCPIRN